jgi:hypothetical protein
LAPTPTPRLLSKITGPFREFGVGAGLLYACDRLLCRLSKRTRLHVYELMVQPITDKPLLPRRLSRLEVREIAPGDPARALMPVRPDVMHAREVQRATCLGAFDKHTLVAYMWFCRNSYDEDEVRCTYELVDPDRSVFDFDFYIFPQHRMGTAFAALWNGANDNLRQRGVCYTFSRLTRFNTASRRAHRHLGWKVAGRALFLTLGRIELMLATIPPYAAASSRGRIRLRMRPGSLESGAEDLA